MSGFCAELLGPGPRTHLVSRHAKFYHALIFSIAIISILLLRYKFADLAQSKSKLAQRIASDSIQVFDHCSTSQCFADQAAYRLVLGTFFFFMFTVLVTGLVPGFHFGYLLQKLLIWIGLVIFSFLVPGSIHTSLMSLLSVSVPILELIASLELISFARDIQHELRRASFVSFFLGVLLALLNVAFGIFSIHNTGQSSCSIIYPVLLAIQAALFIIAIVETIDKGRGSSCLVATSMVTLYTMFTFYRSILYQTSACNSDAGVFASILDYIGIAINLILVVYRCISTRSISIFGSTSAHQLDDAVDLSLPTVIDAKSAPLKEPVRISERWSPIIFYLFLGLVLIHTSRAVDPNRADIMPPTRTSFVLSTSTALATSSLYIWTLVAPRILTNRDFGVKS